MIIKKSIAASFLISLGALGILKIENPYVAAFLFAFGLLTICTLNFNLFTGKCGYYLTGDISCKNLFIILITNLISGYLFGLIYSVGYPDIQAAALTKVQSWGNNASFLLQSFLCGTIMYFAVEIKKSYNSYLGIIYGIPLFILCGMQHSIANVIYMGVARTFNPAIILCIGCNFAGSLLARLVDVSLIEEAK